MISKKKLLDNLLYIAWIQAILAMAGSLYFSEIAKFPPCILCWYQRICMYPIVLLIPVGIIKKDKQNIPFFVLPLAIIGTAISAYHNLLYWKILPESAAPCLAGVSCTTKFIEFFGFVTIPFLSFLGFVVVVATMVLYRRLAKDTK
jgi:disulfide bond formation protein DsbB